MYLLLWLFVCLFVCRFTSSIFFFVICTFVSLFIFLRFVYRKVWKCKDEENMIYKGNEKNIEKLQDSQVFFIKKMEQRTVYATEMRHSDIPHQSRGKHKKNRQTQLGLRKTSLVK